MKRMALQPVVAMTAIGMKMVKNLRAGSSWRSWSRCGVYDDEKMNLDMPESKVHAPMLFGKCGSTKVKILRIQERFGVTV